MAMQTFTGMEYLMIDIANNYGHDKLDWDDRIEWTRENNVQLEKMVADAAEPALFFAGVEAFRKAQRGIPSGYPISLDATCSGIQILSGLTCDRKAASLVNLVDTGHREDAYKTLYHFMLEKIGEEAQISRDDTKNAINQ